MPLHDSAEGAPIAARAFGPWVLRLPGVLRLRTIQKLTFMPNCTIRGSLVDVMVLNKVDVMDREAQQIGLV